MRTWLLTIYLNLQTSSQVNDEVVLKLKVDFAVLDREVSEKAQAEKAADGSRSEDPDPVSIRRLLRESSDGEVEMVCDVCEEREEEKEKREGGDEDKENPKKEKEAGSEGEQKPKSSLKKHLMSSKIVRVPKALFVYLPRVSRTSLGCRIVGKLRNPCISGILHQGDAQVHESRQCARNNQLGDHQQVF